MPTQPDSATIADAFVRELVALSRLPPEQAAYLVAAATECYWSSSGGQADFARGAVMAKHGQSFIVLHATTHDESVSRIVPRLQPGAAVTTFKNIVDRVVTEYGVAELRGSSIRERTRRLIAIAHPSFRDELARSAKEIGDL